jgi:hypothetical protein
MSTNLRWVITEPILVTQMEDEDSYLIAKQNGPGSVLVTFIQADSPESGMYFNGERIDVGDDFIQYVSVLDAYHEMGGETGKTIAQKPFHDIDDYPVTITMNEEQP